MDTHTDTHTHTPASSKGTHFGWRHVSVKNIPYSTHIAVSGVANECSKSMDGEIRGKTPFGSLKMQFLFGFCQFPLVTTKDTVLVKKKRTPKLHVFSCKITCCAVPKINQLNDVCADARYARYNGYVMLIIIRCWGMSSQSTDSHPGRLKLGANRGHPFFTPRWVL